MKLNKRQKSLMVQILVREWESVEMKIFSLSIGDKSKDFERRYKEAIQQRKDIEKNVRYG